MSLRYKALIASVALIGAFATGRYTAQGAPTVKTIEAVKTDTEVKTDKDVRKVTTIDEKTTGEKVTTITEEDVTVTKKQQDQDVSIQQTVTPPKLSPLNVSALIGTDPLNSFKPLYGISVTKQILGPFTIGAFGMSNSVVGLSIGINF